MPQVVVMAGSPNDRKVIKESKMMEVFESVGLNVPVHILSCHRNPQELDTFCREATDIQVFIAAAGLAAALPGALAATTKMAKVVIGVPLDDYGVDTCIRMPPGVSVLTAGVGKTGLFNAAIAACQIVAIGNKGIARSLAAYIDAKTKKPQFDVSLDEA